MQLFPSFKSGVVKRRFIFICIPNVSAGGIALYKPLRFCNFIRAKRSANLKIYGKIL